MTERGSEVVVVGAGVVGAAVAAELAADGWQVRVIDDPAIPGASMASGAMLGVLGEATRGEPETDLLLRLDAAERYPAWLDSIGCHASSGTFVVGNARRVTDTHGTRAIEEAASLHNVPCERVDPADVPGLSPAPGWSPATALYLPDEGWINPSQLVDRLLRYAERQLGARVDAGRVVGLQQRGEQVTGVITDDGAVHACDQVVLCCGANVDRILEGSGLGEERLVPTLLRSKGVAIDLRAPSSMVDVAFPQVVRTPNREFACGLHVVPRGHDTVYVGATNRVSRFPAVLGGVTAGEVALLLADAMNEIRTSLSSWDIVGTTHGLRTLTSDGAPVVGRTAVGGLSIATGMYRNGVLLAPLVARQLSGELAGTEVSHPRFEPSRQVVTPDAPGLLREGLVDMAAQLRDDRDPGWSAMLAGILEALAVVAFGEEREADRLRAHGRAVLEHHGRHEMVPEVIIEMLQAVQPVDHVDRSV